MGKQETIDSYSSPSFPPPRANPSIHPNPLRQSVSLIDIEADEEGEQGQDVVP